MACIEMNTGSFGQGGPSHIPLFTDDYLRSFTVPSNQADSDETQEGDLSDVSSQASDTWSEAPNDSSDGAVHPDDMPDRDPQPVFAMGPVEAMHWFNNHLRDGNITRAEEVALWFPGELALDPQRYADVVGLGLGGNSNHPHVTAIHDIILRDDLEEQNTMFFEMMGDTHSTFALNSFEAAGADMYAPSSGYTDSRISAGFPTVDPVFFAAHRNRNLAILKWYLDYNRYTGKHLIHHRPLLWWLVRHVDAVHPDVLKRVAVRRDINFGVKCIGHHHGPAGSECRFDFTPLDLALIRQPRYVLDTLRHMHAMTSLESLVPLRLLKLYRPGFMEGCTGSKAAHAAWGKRRSSFSFAEEALSSEEGLRVREPGDENMVPGGGDEVPEHEGEVAETDTDIFWEGKPYGPLPRPHPRYSRTMAEWKVDDMFWKEAESTQTEKAPTKRALKRANIAIPATLKHKSRFPGPSSS
ncbi:hypothetical protein IMZ48_05040 [Candidatus Bathyarchaeota archaeon]|nr:hypothetical protein [Candidatus Bathyarchaeota archaeon]